MSPDQIIVLYDYVKQAVSPCVVTCVAACVACMHFVSVMASWKCGCCVCVCACAYCLVLLKMRMCKIGPRASSCFGARTRTLCFESFASFLFIGGFIYPGKRALPGWSWKLCEFLICFLTGKCIFSLWANSFVWKEWLQRKNEQGRVQTLWQP